VKDDQPRSLIPDPWLLLAPVVLFLLLASVALDMPGLHYDEALEGGLPAVQLLNGLPVTTPPAGALHLWGRTVPLMVQSHIGAAQVYAALPFVFLGGPRVSSLRAMTVAAAALTLVAVYLFVAQLYGRLAALYSSLWLATCASFVFWSRQGVFVTSLAPCFAMCALAWGAYWWRAQRWWALALAGLCAGLAIYSKVSALWLLNGLIVWGALAGGRRLPRLLRTWWVRRRALAAGAAGFALGVWPFVLYNLISGGATLQLVRANATQTFLGAHNADVFGNLTVRLAQAADVVRSGDHLWYLGGSFPDEIALASVVAGLLVLIASSLREREQRAQLLLAPCLALLVIVQSCYTVSALWPTHFAIAAPLPAMIFGVAASRSRGWLKRSEAWAGRLARGLIILLIAAVLIAQTITSLRYLNSTITTGGLSFHSTAIYELSRFLENRPEHIVALDWGIAAQVEYLSGGRTQVEEFYGYEQTAPPSFGTALRTRFDRDELYITHTAHREAFQRREAFLATVASAGMWADPIAVPERTGGEPMLEVWRVRRP
jgi:4-amino-4-deoxy-L-arabinose transferase-like glycosyltransferase